MNTPQKDVFEYSIKTIVDGKYKMQLRFTQHISKLSYQMSRLVITELSLHMVRQALVKHSQ